MPGDAGDGPCWERIRGELDLLLWAAAKADAACCPGFKCPSAGAISGIEVQILRVEECICSFRGLSAGPSLCILRPSFGIG